MRAVMESFGVLAARDQRHSPAAGPHARRGISGHVANDTSSL
jgi:hypothetical protein